MKMGVPVEGLIGNGAVTYLAVLWLGHGNLYRMLSCLPIFLVVHFLMRLRMSMYDHNIFRIDRLWLQRGIAVRKKVWEGELLPALPHRAPSSAREIAGSV